MALTYDEYWRKKTMENKVGITAADAYSSALDYAGKKYESAVTSAENAYTAAENAATTALGQNQALVSDAYRRDLATYGRKAEALAQAGLTGSGYSDNLARDAYASRQQGMSEAQLAYSKTLADAASAKELAIGAAADEKMANEYSATAAYQTALAEVEKNAANTALSRAELLDLVNAADTSAPDEVEKALLGGVITADEANAYRDNWNAAIDPATAFRSTDGAYMSSADAKALVRAYKASPWADATKAAALDEEYAKRYAGEATTFSEAKVSGRHDMTVVTVGVGDNKKHYRLDASREEKDETVVHAAEKVPDDTLFSVGGKPYVKRDGKVYFVYQGPYTGADKDYSALLTQLGIMQN